MAKESQKSPNGHKNGSETSIDYVAILDLAVEVRMSLEIHVSFTAFSLILNFNIPPHPQPPPSKMFCRTLPLTMYEYWAYFRCLWTSVAPVSDGMSEYDSGAFVYFPQNASGTVMCVEFLPGGGGGGGV